MNDDNWSQITRVRDAQSFPAARKITQEGFSALMKLTLRFGFPILFALATLASLPASSQDWVHTGSGLGNARIRLAASDFKPVGADAQTVALKATFDSTLFNDLQNAGIFDMVSKSFSPQGTPGSPQEINLAQWSADPANASMVAFGALSAANGRLTVYGWLDDTRNTANPQVLGKQYNETASEDMARTIAHRFADEIILRLGGGINGIAETKIYFISSRTGSKEVWVMDYDGQNQHAVTHLGTVSLSPSHLSRQLQTRIFITRPRGLVHSHVFARPWAHGRFSSRDSWRQQQHPGLVF